MILGLNKHGELHIFASTEDAQRYLEAIDVQQDDFEFCDADGQKYSPSYIFPPKVSRFGLLTHIDIGTFTLKAEGELDPALPEKLLTRARYIEHTSFPYTTDIPKLQNELSRRRSGAT
jgi:hypothetical protein